MHRYILQRVRDRLLDLLRAVPQLWREDSPGLPDATQGMQIPLRPSPVAQKGRWLLHGLLGVYLAQLVLLGHLLVAGMVAVLGGALVWQCRCHRSSAQPALRLLLAADGRIHLLEADGTVEPATLQPCSMRLGLWLLLVLRARWQPERRRKQRRVAFSVLRAQQSRHRRARAVWRARRVRPPRRARRCCSP
jgi:hypothetical protein